MGMGGIGWIGISALLERARWELIHACLGCFSRLFFPPSCFLLLWSVWGLLSIWERSLIRKPVFDPRGVVAFAYLSPGLAGCLLPLPGHRLAGLSVGRLEEMK